MRGLYITHEGILNSIFRSQVLEHGIQMEKFDIYFDVLAYNGYPKLRKLSKKNSKKYIKIFPGKLAPGVTDTQPPDLALKAPQRFWFW